MEAWKIIEQLAPCAHIAHHIPGRIRLKFDSTLLDQVPISGLDPESVRGALADVRGVKTVRFNLLARSCTVDYDCAVIPQNAWADLLAGRATPAANLLIRILHEKYEVPSNA